MSDLPQLLKRLEAVTVRLEDLSANGGVKKGSSAGSASASNDDSSSESPSVAAFEEILTGANVKTFADISAKIGGLVQEQAALLAKALQCQKQLLATASKSKKPDQAALSELVKPMATLVQQIVDIREKNRMSPQFNHLSTISEGVPALSWVMIEPKPAPFVGDMKDASMFYSNRVVKEFKEKDKMHVEWANAFSAALVEIQTFVKKFHTTGLVWNANGGVAPASVASAPAPTPIAAAAGLPSQKPTGAGLFGELNKGGDITSGLKKVDKSQMTHKNPALRASSVVKAEDKSHGIQAPGKAASRGPAKMALEGNKWCVENQEGNKNIVIDQTELKHLVYVYGCNNCVVTIKGKVNAVTLDNCKKTALVVDNVLASIDIVNCKSLQVQILGKTPTALIDKTDGLNLFLSKECLDIEIFTAKSSELNVSIPGKTASDDFIERPIPEQFKTSIKNGSAFTEIVEHHG